MEEVTLVPGFFFAISCSEWPSLQAPQHEADHQHEADQQHEADNQHKADNQNEDGEDSEDEHWEWEILSEGCEILRCDASMT